MKSISMIGLAVLVAAFSNTAFGQNSANPTPSMPSARFSDTHFAAGAASGCMGEVKLGQFAQQNGSSDAVKEFGKRMETDHSKANDQLKDIASKNHIEGGGAELS